MRYEFVIFNETIHRFVENCTEHQTLVLQWLGMKNCVYLITVSFS